MKQFKKTELQKFFRSRKMNMGKEFLSDPQTMIDYIIENDLVTEYKNDGFLWLIDTNPTIDFDNTNNIDIDTNVSPVVNEVETNENSFELLERIESNTVSIDDDFNEFSDFTPSENVTETENKPFIQVHKEPKQRKSRKKSEGEKIDGYIIMLLLDVGAPLILAPIFNMFSKEKKISAKHLVLSESEIERLTPLAEMAANHMSIQTDPVTTFAVVTIVVYAQKVMMFTINSENNE